MKLIKTSLYILGCAALSACVFSQQLKDQKKNKDFDYTLMDIEDETENIFTDNTDYNAPVPVTQARKTNNFIPNDSTIWYHPNPWWEIKTEKFPVSKDSFQYRMFRPQYGLTEFTDTNNKRTPDTWENWQIANKLYNNSEFGGHAWQGFIRAKKSTFEKHPEYLAEKNGERLGFEKTNKLCVSNPKVALLYVEYLKGLITKFPDRKVYSIEPSDGGNFCTCSGCSAIGNTSDQVFFLANKVAETLYKSYPNIKLYLYAYNLHSEVPKFKLHENIIVSVIPKGFQRIYDPEIMMKKWTEVGNHFIYRDYFGIPQWTGDMPRVNVPTLLSRSELARNLKYEAVIMETASNINASILFVLMNAIWMNPDLSWDNVLDKFIADCFPSAPVPMKRLFNRWHNSDNGEQEVGATLYDLQEARKSIKDSLELKRWHDLAAYANYMALYYDWSNDRTDVKKSTKYFDLVYKTGDRNVISSYALTSLFSKIINADSTLKGKYISERKPKTWSKPLTDSEISTLFEENTKSKQLYKNNFSLLNPFQLSPLQFNSNDFFKTVSIALKNIDFCYVVANNTSLSISANYVGNTESPLLVSIFDENLNFVKNMYFENKQTISVKLPKTGVYKLSFNRATRGTLTLEGSTIPILNKTNVNAKLKYYTLESNGEFKSVNTNNFPLDRSPFYFQLNR